MVEFLYIDDDSDDDIRIEALRQALARAGRGRVALILPRGVGPLQNIARLRLLQRQAQVRGQELALATRDPAIRRNAKRLGIPVYEDEAALRGRRWRMAPPPPVIDPDRPLAALPEPPPWRKRDGSTTATAARPSLRRARQRRLRAERAARRPTPLWLRLCGYLFVGLFFAAFLGGFAYYVLPAATVTLVPGQRALERTALLTADPQVEAVDLERGALPARRIQIHDEAAGRVATTGSGWAEVEAAQGEVVFTNLTHRAVRIPAGTIVSSSAGDRIDFRLREELEIPGPIGAQATVPIEATEPGARGNVGSNKITTVAGALRSQVRVTNPAATRGGASTRVRLVTQADRDRLLEQVYAGARERAYEKLAAQLRADEWMPASLVRADIVAQFFDSFKDEPADELNLTLRVLIQGVAISRGASEAAALAALRGAAPERGQLVAESIRFTIEPDSVVSGDALRYAVTASGNYVIPIDAREVSRMVAGLRVDEAARRLQEEWLLAKAPVFYQDPGWFATLPPIASRIQVRVELSEAARGGGQPPPSR